MLTGKLSRVSTKNDLTMETEWIPSLEHPKIAEDGIRYPLCHITLIFLLSDKLAIKRVGFRTIKLSSASVVMRSAQLLPVNNLSMISIPGDGRCLFRSVVHGACLRTGKPPPTKSLEKELADELRANVVNEFIKRRADSEWYLDGDFDTYITHMRQPHVWGGEPELLMASHVLKMPISVYMLDKKSNTLKTIAEYGQGYGKENPIHVLYDGYGHYDVLKNQSGRFQD